MANKNLFQTIVGSLVPDANTRNEAGGAAYRLSPKHALAQLAATGCLNNTFYASAESQLAEVVKLANAVDAHFVAKTAVFCRERGFMKDMPALLCAVLASRDGALLQRIFPRAIDNAKMLRNFVQILRSGQAGRKSLGTRPKRLVNEWLDSRTGEQLFDGNVGQDPSLADVIKMTHPRPRSPDREALYGYLLGQPHAADRLPAKVRQFEAFKAGIERDAPDVPFQMLTALPLTTAHWKQIARRAPWQMTRMNLNTFERHGLFEDREMVRIVATRLRDREAVRRARAFPYQMMAAARNVSASIPVEIREALHDAAEVATENVPRFEGRAVLCPDVSGSMHSPVTGIRKGATSVIRCIDVAGLMASVLLRRNSNATVLPFSDHVLPAKLTARDSVLTNAEKLASLPSGGTNCSAPLQHLNRTGARADIVIFVSDNQSWMDPARGRGTQTMAEWATFRRRNPQARLVCVDIQPYTTVQAAEREDILNIGGFSDEVFNLIAKFAAGEMHANHWFGEIESIAI